MEILSNQSTKVKKKKDDGFTPASDLDDVCQPCFPAETERSCEPKRDVGEIKGWRRAMIDDTPAILKLLNFSLDVTVSLYNKPSIVHLIETSFFPIVQLNDSGEVASFIAYACHPNVPAVPSFCWVEWICEKYDFTDANSRNSLFIHYMVWHPGHTHECFRLLLETPFLEFSYLKYIIFVRPPFVKIPEIYREYFIPIFPSNRDESVSINSLQSINICERNMIVQHLYIRKAIAEDSDVLMCLFRSKKIYYLEKFYGEFFFAELADFPSTKKRHVLVCEYEGYAAGVMTINLSLDLRVLNENFELVPFNGLKKVDEIHSSDSSFTFTTEDPFYEMPYSMNLSTHKYSLNLDSTVKLYEKESNTDISSSESSYEMDIQQLLLTESLSNVSTTGLVTDDDNNDREAQMNENAITQMTEMHNDDKILTEESRILMRNYSKSLNLLSKISQSSVPNAFCIELFAIDDDKIDERLSVDFLEAAFALAPDREYCVITIPSDKVDHRLKRQMRHELYVCHRSSFSSATVRPADLSDLSQVRTLLQHLENRKEILEDVKNSILSDAQELSYCLIIQTRIVGVAVLRFEPNLDDLQFYFDVNNFTCLDVHRTDSRWVIKHLLLSPQYQYFGRFFLMDMMRLADVTCLFHFNINDTRFNASVLSILGDLIPLKPRRKIKTRIQIDKSSDVVSQLLHYNYAFSLFFTSSQLCSQMKMGLNKIIVVVGASKTAYSFFENIVFGSRRVLLNYTNLIWVTAHRMKHDLVPNEARDLMFPIYNAFDDDYWSMLSFQSHVQIIYGLMTEINRQEKYVVINDNFIIKYDILVLTVGLQYQKPVPYIHQTKPQDRCHKFSNSPYSRYFPSIKSEIPREPVPGHLLNLFLINNCAEAEEILNILERVKDLNKEGFNTDKKVVVYGHNIKVFSVLSALLKFGIPPAMIAFVEPFPNREVSITVFRDIWIDAEVISFIKKSGILYYPEFHLYDWTFSTPQQIGTLTFQSSNMEVTLSCIAFMPLEKKSVSDVNYNVCKKSGLLWDGRLIIDCNFRTNDKSIFAAGPFTKYSRRYNARGLEHQYYSSVEVGRKLAEFVLQEVDPFLMQEEADNKGDVPRLTDPIMVYCKLPGDFYYFLLCKPGKMIDNECGLNNSDFADVLITGDCSMSKGQGYFRIQLDDSGCVQSIICFNNDKIDCERFFALYGKHERALNNLLMRYDSNMINNFYEYFKQPWSDVIFHPEFRKVSNYNAQLFYDGSTEIGREPLVNLITKYLRENKSIHLPDDTKNRIESLYEESILKVAIETNLYDFAYYFKDELNLNEISEKLIQEEKSRKESLMSHTTK